MILISHRGNINGRNIERENSPEYIDEAIAKGYLVEIDIRMILDKIFLGHDESQHEVSLEWLLKRRYFIVLHCKNVEALYKFKKLFRCFYHDMDDCVLMSNTDWIWTFPGKYLTKDSIAVMPERIRGWHDFDFKHDCMGVCSDFVENYK